MGDVAADAEEDEDEEDEAEEVVAVVSVGSVPAAVAAQAEGALDGKEGGGRDREGKTKMAGSRGSFGEIGLVLAESAELSREMASCWWCERVASIVGRMKHKRQ